MRLSRRAPLLAAGLLSVAALASGCSSGPDDPDTLVLYNAQHEDFMELMTDAFTAKTGIEVEIRKGGDTSMANLIVKEGEDSPADVFVTENSPAMAIVDKAGLFAPLPQPVLEAVPPQYQAADDTWAGFAGRSTTFVYSPAEFPDKAALPDSMLDLMKPQWKGRFGYAPQGADFQAIVAALYALKGEQTGDRFVQALKDNGERYANNIAIMQAVNSGQVDSGLIYHYYWYQDQAAGGGISDNTELHYFGDQDPGAFLSISGVGILESSNKSADAAAFVSFLTGPEGQQLLADSEALEYPIASDVAPNPVLPTLEELDPPVVPIAELDGPAVIEEFREVGIL